MSGFNLSRSPFASAPSPVPADGDFHRRRRGLPDAGPRGRPGVHGQADDRRHRLAGRHGEMEELVAEPLEKRMQELRWCDRTETFTRRVWPSRWWSCVTARRRPMSRAVLSGAEEARRRGAQVAAWRHRSDGERRICRRDLCALRVEGEGRASSARSSAMRRRCASDCCTCRASRR